MRLPANLLQQSPLGLRPAVRCPPPMRCLDVRPADRQTCLVLMRYPLWQSRPFPKNSAWPPTGMMTNPALSPEEGSEDVCRNCTSCSQQHCLGLEASCLDANLLLRPAGSSAVSEHRASCHVSVAGSHLRPAQPGWMHPAQVWRGGYPAQGGIIIG